METHSESASSEKTTEGRPQPAGWLKVSVIAAASALAGGLAAAWFYRKTLRDLQNAESDSNFRISESTDDDNT